MRSLELVYQYRRLLAKCESSAGLTLEEIERFSQLEDSMPTARPVDYAGHLRGRRFVDPISVLELSRLGAVCHQCPYVEVDQVLELRIKHGDRSYRFAARVESARECADDSYLTHFAFEGSPVLVRNTREIPAFEIEPILIASAA